MTQPDNAKIAIVDFASFLDGSNKQSVADAMLESFKEIGFVYLVNHGLPKDKIQSTLSISYTRAVRPTDILYPAMFDWVLIVLLIHFFWISNVLIVEKVFCSANGSKTTRPAPSLRHASPRYAFMAFVNGKMSHLYHIYTGYSAPGVEKVSQHIYDEKEISAHRAKAPDVKESFEARHDHFITRR